MRVNDTGLCSHSVTNVRCHLHHHTSCCSLSTACVTLSSPGCWYFCCMLTFRFCLSSSSNCGKERERVSEREVTMWLPSACNEMWSWHGPCETYKLIPHASNFWPWVCRPNLGVSLMFWYTFLVQSDNKPSQSTHYETNWLTENGNMMKRLPGSREENTVTRKEGKEMCVKSIENTCKWSSCC